MEQPAPPSDIPPSDGSNHNQNSRLLDLPAELRNTIFEFAIDSSWPKPPYHTHAFKTRNCVCSSGSYINHGFYLASLSLVQVCHQFRVEMYNLLIGCIATQLACLKEAEEQLNLKAQLSGLDPLVVLYVCCRAHDVRKHIWAASDALRGLESLGFVVADE